MLTVGELIELLSLMDQSRPVMVWDFTTGVPMRPTILNGNIWEKKHVTIWPSDVAADGTTRTDPREMKPTYA